MCRFGVDESVDGFVGRWLVIGLICRPTCSSVGGVWVDVTLGGWSLLECVDGCGGMWVLVGWMCR